MRIAVNTRFLVKDGLEGVGRYTHESLRRLVLEHPDDSFYFFFDREYDPSFVYASNVIPIVMGPPARHPVLWFLWFEFSVPYLLKKHKIDVFLSMDTYASLGTKTPTVLISHDIAYAHYPEHIPWTTRKYYQYFFPKFHKLAKRIVTVSQATKKDIIQTYGLNNANITVGYNSVPNKFEPILEVEKEAIREQYTSGKPFFIYVGAVHPRKNIVRLIQAFDIYKAKSSRDYKLLIVGRKAWKNNDLEKVYQGLAYRSDIIFTDTFVPDVSKILASSEGLAYVSLFEGFGIPLLEAMHTEVPLLTSNTSSMPEVAGDAAILVNPKNIEDIADGFLQLEDPIVVRNLIAKGKVQREKFSWDTTAQVIYQAILEAAES